MSDERGTQREGTRGLGIGAVREGGSEEAEETNAIQREIDSGTGGTIVLQLDGKYAGRHSPTSVLLRGFLRALFLFFFIASS
jgi:hypothetical protein